MKIKVEDLIEILEDQDNIVEDTYVDSGRWSAYHDVVFKLEDKLYIVSVERPLTEYQEVENLGLGDDDAMVEVQEVIPVETTVIKYEVVR